MARVPQDFALSSTNYILKVASRCNINCSYCYMYNKGDHTFETRPRFMDITTADKALRRINEYAANAGISQVNLVLHGGEPLMVGKSWMRRFLRLVHEHLVAARPTVVLQTNAILVDAEWVD